MCVVIYLYLFEANKPKPQTHTSGIYQITKE